MGLYISLFLLLSYAMAVYFELWLNLHRHANFIKFKKKPKDGLLLSPIDVCNIKICYQWVVMSNKVWVKEELESV